MRRSFTRGLLLLVSACGLAGVASADTFTYSFAFENDHQISGEITTDCNNCVIHASDLVSWQFFFDGTAAIQSINNPGYGLSIGAGTGNSGLTATPTALYFAFTDTNQNDIPRILFANDGSFQDSIGFASAAFAGGSGNVIYSYAFAPGNPLVFAIDPGCTDGCSIATFASSTLSNPTPEPGTIALLLSGVGLLAGVQWRRRTSIA